MIHFPTFHCLAALAALATVAAALSACTSYKAPAKDANAGGGNMYRASEPQGVR
jgi:hypothetical protein